MLSLSGVLEPMKYSQKVPTPLDWLNWAWQDHQARSTKHLYLSHYFLYLQYKNKKKHLYYLIDFKLKIIFLCCLFCN